MNRLAALLTLSISCISAATARAGQITTRAALDAILTDHAILEDFEGVSVAGGEVRSAPNPLSSANQPAFWGLASGVTYGSNGTLALYGGYLHGDSSNILEGSNGLLITFAQPQRAVGMDVVDGTGNVAFPYTIEFLHNQTVLGTLNINLAQATDAFAGWQDVAQGITSVRVTVTSPIVGNFAEVDNLGWGITVTPAACRPDFNNSGAVTVQDIFDFLAAWFAADPRANFNATGGITVQDIFDFLSAWFAGCP